MAFIAAAPSPFHAVAEASGRLEAAGFTRLDPTASWSDAPDRSFVARGGSLIAWAAPVDRPPETPFHLVGAHTDSPNLRIKPRPDTGRAGWRQLGVEVYGGALLNSWLDRDLGLSGRVIDRSADGPRRGCSWSTGRCCGSRSWPSTSIARSTRRGSCSTRSSTWLRSGGSALPSSGEFRRVPGAGDRRGRRRTSLAWDVMTHDLTPPAVLGVDGELLASARLDNLCSCWTRGRPR